jgi:hypothetical protein
MCKSGERRLAIKGDERTVFDDFIFRNLVADILDVRALVESEPIVVVAGKKVTQALHCRLFETQTDQKPN